MISDIVISNPAILISETELASYIDGCSHNKRESQYALYKAFYGYALSICNNYAANQDDALEILNDGFLKVFKEVYRYKPAYADTISSFKGWLRKIMVYTSIDHFRKQHRERLLVSLNELPVEIESPAEDAIDKLDYENLLAAIRELSPAYRTVFSLFVIEGFSHEEIATHLQINIGTSKSNLAKARKQLQKILFHHHQIHQRNVV